MKNNKISKDDFFKIRKEVLTTWETGEGVTDIEDGFQYQSTIPEHKNFAKVIYDAEKAGRTLIQPRAGVALVNEHIELLTKLQEVADLLPTTIDAYTRLNNYEDAQRGIEESRKAGHSLLNGFPGVNHGVIDCRRIIEAVDKPVEVRHGTPDGRLLAEISMAAGFTSYEGGGISYNLPYVKNVTLEKSIRDWQYVDRLIGLYEEQGIRINREPFGPLSGTLVSPFMSNSVAVLEGLLALEQGVKSITLGYGQCGNMVQDVAAVESLREMANEYFYKFGYEDYELTTVVHQWMGGFPEDEARAFSVIGLGSIAAKYARASKVIVKTPHEARGIPTAEANLAGMRATKQVLSMLAEQSFPVTGEVSDEKEIIKDGMKSVIDTAIKLGDGNLAKGVEKAILAGVIDVPFAPSIYNAGKMFPVRGYKGAVRVLDKGNIPLSDKFMKYHRDLINNRAKEENREPSFQMTVDDIYAIGKGKLVGRPKV